MALYGSHDIFRADNAQGSAIRRQSAREAVQDAVLWLKDGNSVAVSYFSTILIFFSPYSSTSGRMSPTPPIVIMLAYMCLEDHLVLNY